MGMGGERWRSWIPQEMAMRLELTGDWEGRHEVLGCCPDYDGAGTPCVFKRKIEVVCVVLVVLVLCGSI